jgi:hypothetical protein
MREKLPVRVPGAQNRTLRNRLGYLGTFFGKYGVQLKKTGQRQAKADLGLLFRTDIPKNMKKKPKKYEQSTIETLLTNADDNKTLSAAILGVRGQTNSCRMASDRVRASSTARQGKLCPPTDNSCSGSLGL